MEKRFTTYGTKLCFANALESNRDYIYLGQSGDDIGGFTVYHYSPTGVSVVVSGGTISLTAKRNSVVRAANSLKRIAVREGLKLEEITD